MLERHLVERHSKAQRGDAPQQGVEHDLKLGAGELLPDALMAAVAEAELLAGVAGEIQLVGLRIGGRIPVRGREVEMMPSPARMVSPPISMSSMATRRWPFWMIDR